MSKKITIAIIAIIIASATGACSSPERDGRRAAQNFCDCNDDFFRTVAEETRRFVNRFDRFGFQTRVEAREHSEQLIEEANREHRECVQEAQQRLTRLRERHIGNPERAIEFERAYLAAREQSETNAVRALPNQAAINDLILTIIPPKPDEEKIKRDLIGRRITPQIDGYYDRNWFWEIQGSDIQEFQLVSEEKRGENYWFQVRIVVQRHGGAHEAVVNLTYVLREHDDWTIEFLENVSMNFVRTGNFDNCIRIERWISTLIFHNSCDVALVVGGAILRHDNQWHRFHITVQGNNVHSPSIGGVLDYQIHFIERP